MNGDHLPGCKPLVLISLIKACSHQALRENWTQVDGQLVKITSLEQAMALHSQASLQNLDWNVYVASSLVDVYAKCGTMHDSQWVFDSIPQRNVVSWTSLIAGYARNGHGTTALERFQEMHSRARAAPNAQTFVAALQACAATLEERCSKDRVLETCMALHSRAAKLGLDSDVFLANSLVDVYSRSGSLEDARRVFEGMPNRDVVSWNSMMAAFALHGHPQQALDLFVGMKFQGCAPSAQTFAVLLKAAAKLGALQTGKILHAEISRYCCLDPELRTNCLVDFYGKCGSMVNAQRVFDSTSSSDCSIVTWNSLLVGYSRQGDTTRVFALFEALDRVALRPNGVTFSALLAASSHAGLVDKGLEHFHSMLSSYGVSPDAQHCRCMVDVLGRANRLEEAVQMANMYLWSRGNVGEEAGDRCNEE
ncbi:putative pentatricopeptide repeat-containing protein At3g13770, mitochondrial [Selaginella moellendorffii]|uniref:putative pentatricopeptide repeat-containing protein At3g13770, mitochondrial n=1 Tax=Selaginella moellendorffii TaxID=88036 RepID=UPI000D1CC5E2|nr:putative pentatricopeptide repeat-containing protein At3g13770, mitochondrial [Selaginella moellendorffii]|eukprot:XP_024517628.1 putative pentatricopeptide repeat-containing protein At3g13770, mitochondrial [Selaginella moellendorffii]